MGLKSLEALTKKKKAPKVSKKVVELSELDDDEDVFTPPKPVKNGQMIIRTPRIAVDPKVKKSAEILKEAAAPLITATNGFAVKRETQGRRELIIGWMLNGHMYDGELMSTTELANKLAVPMETLERDINTIKTQFSDFYTDPNRTDKELPAYAYMLLEMKMQDRGRALALYNEIANDIKALKGEGDDDNESVGRVKRALLSGRDLAAMRSAQLSALEVANKATAGLNELFKLLGGPEKVLNIIKAKTVMLAQGNNNTMGNISMDALQDTIGAMPEFRSVLPSTRTRDKLAMPAFLDITDEDKEILEVGAQARSGK